MHQLILFAAVAVVVAAAVLAWPAAAGGLDRRRLDVRDRRAAHRRRARAEVDQLQRFGPRRRRAADGTRLVARLQDDPPTAALDGDSWSRMRDGLARTHRRL